MNCLYETIAGVYLRARSRLVPQIEDDVGDAEENLESCRAGLAARERDMSAQCKALAAAAAGKKKAGDVSGARFALVERKRVLGRLEKVRNGMALIDKQLDALQSSELDKQLMESLKLSSQAMRRAGIGQGLEEAESVMNELDDRIREASELTTVLATPLVNSTGEDDAGIDVDEELGLIERESAAETREAMASAAIQVVAVQSEDAPRQTYAEAVAPQGRGGRVLANTMDF